MKEPEWVRVTRSRDLERAIRFGWLGRVGGEVAKSLCEYVMMLDLRTYMSVLRDSQRRFGGNGSAQRIVLCMSFIRVINGNEAFGFSEFTSDGFDFFLTFLEFLFQSGFLRFVVVKVSKWRSCAPEHFGMGLLKRLEFRLQL